MAKQIVTDEQKLKDAAQELKELAEEVRKIKTRIKALPFESGTESTGHCARAMEELTRTDLHDAAEALAVLAEVTGQLLTNAAQKYTAADKSAAQGY